jgi:hypothetical protein
MLLRGKIIYLAPGSAWAKGGQGVDYLAARDCLGKGGQHGSDCSNIQMIVLSANASGLMLGHTRSLNSRASCMFSLISLGRLTDFETGVDRAKGTLICVVNAYKIKYIGSLVSRPFA